MNRDTIGSCLSESFEKWGEKSAISFLQGGRLQTRLSYSDLRRHTNQMAQMFLDAGAEKGDRIIVFLPKSMASVVALIALQRIGVVAVPLNPGFTSSEMTYLLSDAKAKIILAEPKAAIRIKRIDSSVKIVEIDKSASYQDARGEKAASDPLPAVNLSSDDPGLIIYTSGTTGSPKGAILTQKNLIHDADNIIKVWKLSNEDTLCHALPLFHVHGLCFALHTSLLAGSHIVMLDEFKPQVVMKALSGPIAGIPEAPCNVFMAVPAMYQKLLDAAVDPSAFSHLRLLTSGSAPLLPKDFQRIKDQFGKEPVEREGMSETGMNFSNPINGVRKAGSIGLPLPELQARIVNPSTLLDVGAGQTGEIWLKSASISPGYWRKPEATAQAFYRDWFRTGDLGNVDDDGYYYLTDRIKHIIISGGENISPKEIESVINRCEDVSESAVVGIPDEKWGEKVAAAVVAKDGADNPIDQIQTLCRTHLHKWKIPKEFRLMDALPRNTMGKVLVEEVKAAFRHSGDE